MVPKIFFGWTNVLFVCDENRTTILNIQGPVICQSFLYNYVSMSIVIKRQSAVKGSVRDKVVQALLETPRYKYLHDLRLQSSPPPSVYSPSNRSEALKSTRTKRKRFAKNFSTSSPLVSLTRSNNAISPPIVESQVAKKRTLFNEILFPNENGSNRSSVRQEQKTALQRRSESRLQIPTLQRALTQVVNTVATTRSRPPVQFSVLDATFGMGDMSAAILQHTAPFGRVCAMDIDKSLEVPFGTELRRIFGVEHFTFLAHPMSGVRGLFPERFFDAIIVDMTGPCEAQFVDEDRGLDLTTGCDGPCTFRYAKAFTVRGDKAVVNGYDSITDLLNLSTYEELMSLFHDDVGVSYSKSNSVANTIIRSRPWNGLLRVSSLLENFFGEIHETEFEDNGAREKLPFRPNLLQKVIMALQETVNRERQEFKTFLDAVPYLLRPWGRCIVNTRRQWQKQILSDLENQHPYMYCPQFPSGTGLWVIEKSTRNTDKRKLEYDLGARSSVRQAPEKDIENMLLSGKYYEELREYPGNSFDFDSRR